MPVEASVNGGSELFEGEDIYKKKLSLFSTVRSPYGKELTQKVLQHLVELSTQGTLNVWLTELNLKSFHLGKFDLSQPPIVAATYVLSEAYKHGAEDYIPLLERIIKDIDIEMPEEMTNDIAAVRKWMLEKHGITI